MDSPPAGVPTKQRQASEPDASSAEPRAQQKRVQGSKWSTQRKAFRAPSKGFQVPFGLV